MSGSVEYDKFLAGLRAMLPRFVAAAERAVTLTAEEVLGDAQELAPVDTGDLKASGTRGPVEVNGANVSTWIGFNTDYALFVHENLTSHHDQGQAKFIEMPLHHHAARGSLQRMALREMERT